MENRRILVKVTIKKNTSQQGEFLNFLRPLMRACLPWMKTVLVTLTKSVLLPFGLSVAMSVIDAAIQRKSYGSDRHPLDCSQQQ